MTTRPLSFAFRQATSLFLFSRVTYTADKAVDKNNDPHVSAGSCALPGKLHIKTCSEELNLSSSEKL